jgi:predicted secreted protein
MIKTRLLTIIALLGLTVMVFGACSEPTPSPTPPTETAIQNAVEARNAALAYLQTASGDILGSDANWQETDTTTPGLVGGVKKQYTTDDWTIGVAYNVVRPDQVVYHIVISSVKHGLHWEGQVKADGTVNEISPLIEMSEGESKKVAENFIKNSPTFTFDGMEDTLKLIDTLRARCPYCWVFVFEFDSAHAGYGNRTGQAVLEVITHHRASVAIEQMKVASAVIDDEWDMIRQEIIGSQQEEQEGALSVAELLANPVYDITVTVYGEVSLLGELLCPCFELSSGGEKIQVWHSLMVENYGTDRPAVDVTGIDNGDTIIVKGELKGKNGTHYSKGDFWAQIIVLPLQTLPEGPALESVAITCDEFTANQFISKTIEISVGQMFGVILCSNPSTGFQWSETAQIDDPTLLQQTHQYYQAPADIGGKPPAPGTPGKEEWTFKALRAGTTQVYLEYSRPWEGGDKGEWTFELTVSVK